MYRKRKLRVFLCILVLIAIFFFMGKYLYQNWQKVPFEKLKFNWTVLICSYFFYACSFLMSSLIWKVNLAYIRENLSFMKSLRITAFSFIARYVPGKVWGMFAQIWLTKKEGGISGEKGGVCIVLSTAISILSAALLALIILPFVLKNKFSPNFYLLFAIIPVLFIILYPPIFIKVINFGLRKLKREAVQFVPKYTQLLKLLLLYISFWISQCVAMYSFIRSFYLISPSFLIKLCGIHPATWVIGFLSFITPGGLGVREGTLAYFLSFCMPTSIGIVASIAIRIWATIGELAFFAIFARSIKKYI